MSQAPKHSLDGSVNPPTVPGPFTLSDPMTREEWQALRPQLDQSDTDTVEQLRFQSGFESIHDPKEGRKLREQYLSILSAKVAQLNKEYRASQNIAPPWKQSQLSKDGERLTIQARSAKEANTNVGENSTLKPSSQ